MRRQVPIGVLISGSGTNLQSIIDAVGAKELQGRERAGDRGAQAEVGLGVLRGADTEPVAVDLDLERDGGRFERERDAAAVELAQCRLRIRVEREHAVQRELERAAGEGLEGVKGRGSAHAGIVGASLLATPEKGTEVIKGA